MSKEKRSKEKKADKFDYKGYVSNLGKVGTFYADKKDSKGVEGTLVSIAENGVYAKTKTAIFPQLFARADFNTGTSFKCSCGKTITVIIGEGSSEKKHKHSDGNSKYSDDGSKGKFGSNGGQKAKAMYGFIKSIEDLDTDDEDDCEEIVEEWKKALKAFK